MDSLENNWTLLLLLMVFGLFQNQDKNRINFWSDPNQSTAAKSISPYFSLEQAFCNAEDSVKLKELQSTCERIEWEQDMGKHIPFCKIDGQLCNGQCRK